MRMKLSTTSFRFAEMKFIGITSNQSKEIDLHKDGRAAKRRRSSGIAMCFSLCPGNEKVLLECITSGYTAELFVEKV